MVTLVRWGSHHILLLDDLGAVYYPGPLEPTRGLRLVAGCTYVHIEMFFLVPRGSRVEERGGEREKSSMDEEKI